MEVLLKAFNEESFSHHGKHYQIRPRWSIAATRSREVTLVLRALHRPVEIWQPIASGKTLAVHRPARGIKGMVTLNGEKIFDEVARTSGGGGRPGGAGARAGPGSAGAWGSTWPIPRRRPSGALSPTTTSATQWFAPFGFVRYADADGRPVGHTGRARAYPQHPRRRRAEGLAVRPATARDRGDPALRGQVPGPRPDDDPLGGGHGAEGVQGAARMVRPRGDARLHEAIAHPHDSWHGPGVYPHSVVLPRGGPPEDCIFPLHSLVGSRYIPSAGGAGRHIPLTHGRNQSAHTV